MQMYPVSLLPHVPFFSLYLISYTVVSGPCVTFLEWDFGIGGQSGSTDHTPSTTFPTRLFILPLRTPVTLPIPIFIICVPDSSVACVAHQNSRTSGRFEYAIDPLIEEGGGFVITPSSYRLGYSLALYWFSLSSRSPGAACAQVWGWWTHGVCVDEALGAERTTSHRLVS